MAAALAAQAGWARNKIHERLSGIREKTELIYTLDTLEYLARGGRIGRVKALAGALSAYHPHLKMFLHPFRMDHSIRRQIASVLYHKAHFPIQEQNQSA